MSSLVLYHNVICSLHFQPSKYHNFASLKKKVSQFCNFDLPLFFSYFGNLHFSFCDLIAALSIFPQSYAKVPLFIDVAFDSHHVTFL